MFPLGQNVVSGVVHWMVVRRGLTQQRNVVAKPKEIMIKEKIHLGLFQVPESVRQKVSCHLEYIKIYWYIG